MGAVLSTHHYGVFASRWPLGDGTVWTIVNRGEYAIAGRQMTVARRDGVRYFDLYRGTELKPEQEEAGDVLSSISSRMASAPSWPCARAHARRASIDGEDARHDGAAPIELLREWKVLPQQQVEIRPTAPSASAPEGWSRSRRRFPVPGGGNRNRGIERYRRGRAIPWEPTPRRFHEHRIKVAAFFMDRYPVTNAQFKKFLDATHYRPRTI